MCTNFPKLCAILQRFLRNPSCWFSFVTSTKLTKLGGGPKETDLSRKTGLPVRDTVP